MRLATIIILVATFTFLVTWTSLAAFTNDKLGDTVSEVIREAAWHAAVIPYSFGVLLGHWLWPGSPVLGPPMAPILLATLGIAVTLAHIKLRKFGYKKSPTIVYTLIGIPLGHWFWPL